MHIEYSSEKDNKFCLSFTSSERKTLKNALNLEIKRLSLQLDRTINSPKNEGQVKFSEKIKSISYDIQFCNELIETLNF